MMAETLVFSNRPSPWALALGAAILTATWWSNRSARLQVVSLLLKGLGTAALLFCLLEPIWSGQRAVRGANAFVLLADNSRALQVKDSGQTLTRGEQLQRLLASGSSQWQDQLEDEFDLRRFFFDVRLQSTANFQDLTFEGRASALGQALHSMADRLQGRPVAGVLLFTDGNATDVREPFSTWPGLPPVYPVVIGKPGPVRDLALAQVNVTQTAFEDAPVSLQANVLATHFAGEKIVADLFDFSGRKIERRALAASGDRATVPFRFRLRPDKPGISFYRLRVGLADEIDSSLAARASREATLLNNSQVVAVDRGRGPYRILYVAGRPNWEFKFLNRAVQEDDQLQLVALLRVAKREPKFEFRGRPGETSNPLFRGFGNQSREEAGSYDQPVLIRLNTRDQSELRGGFPRTPEELYSYDAVILDDVEAGFFLPDQAALLQKFVSERGGGFLMLGGMESFREGHYQRTPIGDMLPVYLDGETSQPPAKLRLNLTREGWLQPWARLRDNESDEKDRLQKMPPFLVFNPVGEIKPGASVMATVAGEKAEPLPALITQRFGRGRTAALTIGDIWHWGLHDSDSHRDMDKAWRQLLRWLVSDVPSRVELAIDNRLGTEPVQIEVRLRDAKFQPLDEASVTVEIKPVLLEQGQTAQTLRLRAEPSLDEPGLYQTAFLPRAGGGYQATAYATNSVGAEMGRAQAAWTTSPEPFPSLEPNLSLLKEMARRTGGEVVPADQLAQFARRAPHRHAPVMEPWNAPAWHTPALFLFTLACFVAEWGLRRWKGLP